MGMHGPTCVFWANLTPFSLEADALLGKFVHEAWTVMAEGGGLHDTPAGLAPVQNVYAGMCCTHYGYSLPLWNKALAVEAATGAGGIDTGVVSTCINPNSDMAGFIFKQGMRENAPSCEISIKVLSMVTLTTEIDSIAPLLSGPARRRPHPPRACPRPFRQAYAPSFPALSPCACPHPFRQAYAPSFPALQQPLPDRSAMDCGPTRTSSTCLTTQSSRAGTPTRPRRRRRRRSIRCSLTVRAASGRLSALSVFL